MNYYIIRTMPDGTVEKGPSVYFTKDAAQKSCDWNNKMYSGYWEVKENNDEE